MHKPAKSDPSKPQVENYDYKKSFYRSQAVADDYDQHRFTTPERKRRNERKWRAIEKALALAPRVRRILDLPCGTGRFTGRFAAREYEVIGSDISLEMIGKARAMAAPKNPGILGYVQANAEKLPFRDAAVDCVVSIRFMFHVDREVRIRILKEFARISNRWQIIDYRHKYSLRYRKWRVLRALGLTREPLERVSRERLEHEYSSAGLKIRSVINVSSWFSDKWVVLSERTGG